MVIFGIFNEKIKNGIWFWRANQIVFKNAKKNVTWQWSVSNKNTQYRFYWVKWRESKRNEIGESKLTAYDVIIMIWSRVDKKID